MQTLINVGDKIISGPESRYDTEIVTQVVPGSHGLLIRTRANTGEDGSAFYPWELPVQGTKYHWYGWHTLSHETFLLEPYNLELAYVSIGSSDPLDDIKGYCTKWQHTVELIRRREGGENYGPLTLDS